MFNPSELSLTALPSARLDALRSLPQCQGIYFAVASDAVVLYIGKAKNIFKRWTGHHRRFDVRQWGDVSIFWLRFDGDARLLHEIEKACIAHFDPVLNGRPTGAPTVHFQLVIPSDVLDEVRALAESENRSISNMLATLVAEAIKTRKERERKEPGPMRRTVLASARL